MENNNLEQLVKTIKRIYSGKGRFDSTTTIVIILIMLGVVYIFINESLAYLWSLPPSIYHLYLSILGFLVIIGLILGKIIQDIEIIKKKNL